MILIFLLLVLNFGISWFNAHAVGQTWSDTKVIGGWPRFITWCAAIMSASGFTWCYLIIAAIIAGATGTLPQEYVQIALEIGYVVIIFPVLGSGLGIWIDSVATAWRKRNIRSIGFAAWNTFAMAHNVYSAAKALPGIFENLGDVFAGGEGDSKSLRIALLLVLFALIGGILTTVAIVRVSAKKRAKSVMRAYQNAQKRRNK